MPAVSQKQAKLMYATLNGADTGVPKKVAEDFVEHTPSVKDLPKETKKKRTYSKLF